MRRTGSRRAAPRRTRRSDRSRPGRRHTRRVRRPGTSAGIHSETSRDEPWAANSVATPPCTATRAHQVPGGRSTAPARQHEAALRHRLGADGRPGVALSSGCPGGTGRHGAGRAAPRGRARRSSCVQWIGTNTEPGGCPSATATSSSADPDALDTRASSPSSQPEPFRVGRRHLHEGHGAVGPEPRRAAGAGHGVPMVAHAAGVQPDRIRIGKLSGERGHGRSDEVRPTLGREEAAIREEPRRPGAPRRDRPLHGIEVRRNP